VYNPPRKSLSGEWKYIVDPARLCTAALEQSNYQGNPDIQEGWNRKGLISEEGERKKAFDVLKKYYYDKAAGIKLQLSAVRQLWCRLNKSALSFVSFLEDFILKSIHYETNGIQEFVIDFFDLVHHDFCIAGSENRTEESG
jgi:hypothetical protein